MAKISGWGFSQEPEINEMLGEIMFDISELVLHMKISKRQHASPHRRTQQQRYDQLPEDYKQKLREMFAPPAAARMMVI